MNLYLVELDLRPSDIRNRIEERAKLAREATEKSCVGESWRSDYCEASEVIPSGAFVVHGHEGTLPHSASLSLLCEAKQMKLGVAAATQIANFICGDGNGPFPYRSGSTLTHFFTALGHGYRIADYSSRGSLAQTAMVQIDTKSGNAKSPSLADEVVEIIEALMCPSEFAHFKNEAKERYVNALKLINRTLSHTKTEVVVVDGKPVVQSNDGTVLTTVANAVKAARKFTFSPSVFSIPDEMEVQQDLVAVMMPFSAEFKPVLRSIRKVCQEAGMRCKRADNLWKESTFIQDIFELICASRCVIVDFSHKNANVFYEAGIAHTLGKNVIPLVQSIEHIPSDLRQHRAIEYHANAEGLARMRRALGERLRTLIDGHDWANF